MMCSTLHGVSMMSLEFTSTIILKESSHELILSQGLSWMCSCSVLHSMVLFEMGPEMLFLGLLHECRAVACLWNNQDGLRIDPTHVWWWMFVEIVHYPSLEMDSYTASPHGLFSVLFSASPTLIDVWQNSTRVIRSRETNFPVCEIPVFYKINMLHIFNI